MLGDFEAQRRIGERSGLGLIPFVEVFTVKELEASIVGAGFRIEYQWQPAPGKAVFIVARKIG